MQCRGKEAQRDWVHPPSLPPSLTRAYPLPHPLCLYPLHSFEQGGVYCSAGARRRSKIRCTLPPSLVASRPPCVPPSMTSALPRTVGHALRHSNSLGTWGCAAPSPALQPAPGLQPGSWRARHGNHLSVRTSTCSSTSSPVEALGSLSRLGRKSKDRLRSTDNGRGARLQCMAAPGSPSGW